MTSPRLQSAVKVTTPSGRQVVSRQPLSAVRLRYPAVRGYEHEPVTGYVRADRMFVVVEGVTAPPAAVKARVRFTWLRLPVPWLTRQHTS